MSVLVDAASHRAVLAYRYAEYENGVKDGTITPFVYPLFTYGTAILFLFLLIPPNSVFHCRTSRYLTFAVIFFIHTWLISNCRANGPATSLGMGIVLAWGTAWAAVLLVFKDGKVEFKRIERKIEKEMPGGLEQSRIKGKVENELRKRNTFSGTRADTSVTQPNGSHKILYFWQSFPNSPLKSRIIWIAHLATSFRGIGWNWRTSGLPSLPPAIQAQLSSKSMANDAIKDIPRSRSGLRRFGSSRELVWHGLWGLTSSYIILDILKIIMIHDPYFWGLIDSVAPAYLPDFIRSSGVLVRCYRLFVSQCGVWITLRYFYSLAPLFLGGVLGPEYLGVYGEPWAYPDIWGSYSNVLDRGLSGWWGGWWHQMFRSAFESGGIWVASGLGLDPKSRLSRAIQLFVAFGLSGYIHGCGSKTSIGNTDPWEIFLFFIIQPVGIMIEMFWRHQFRTWGLSSHVPRPLAQATSFLYTQIWLYYTGNLLADDFAKSGAWLFEPIPFSPLRALGMGAEGDGFFCWRGRFGEWRSDQNFLLSGIAL